MFPETYPTHVVIDDFSLPNSRRRSRPHTETSRPSLPSEQAEFAGLLDFLGVAYRPGRSGWQPVRCWNRKAHTHGDHSPSASVKLSDCWFRCHGCGIEAGLVSLREHAGQSKGEAEASLRTPPNKAGRYVLGEINHLVRLCEFGSPILAKIPPEALEKLRAETGRHKRDRALERNLRRMIAAVVDRMATDGHTHGVRFTATDAMLAGIRAETWGDLLSLLPCFGVRVHRGESGRTCSKRVESRERKHLEATTLTATAPKTEYSMKEREQVFHPSEPSIPNSSIPHLAQIAAAQASYAKPEMDGPSLYRKHGQAEVLALLGTLTGERPATGGATGPLTSLTFQQLRQVFGPRVRRTVRELERAELVAVVRIAEHGRHSRAGFVTLTELGREVFQRDVEAGRALLRVRVEIKQQQWRDALDRLPEMRKTRARCFSGGEFAPWEPQGDGSHVVNVLTGEVRLLSDLAVSTESDRPQGE